MRSAATGFLQSIFYDLGGPIQEGVSFRPLELSRSGTRTCKFSDNHYPDTQDIRVFCSSRCNKYDAIPLKGISGILLNLQATQIAVLSFNKYIESFNYC